MSLDTTKYDKYLLSNKKKPKQKVESTKDQEINKHIRKHPLDNKMLKKVFKKPIVLSL